LKFRLVFVSHVGNRNYIIRCKQF